MPGATYGLGTGINFVSNGGRNDTSEVLIDGIAATSYEPNTSINTPSTQPSVEAVQEFKIMQNNYSAEEGFSGNTYINTGHAARGPTTFHGDVYEFAAQQRSGLQQLVQQRLRRQDAPLRNNQFGGTIGGPIKKDKTFFFFDFDGTRERTGARQLRCSQRGGTSRRL